MRRGAGCHHKGKTKPSRRGRYHAGNQQALRSKREARPLPDRAPTSDAAVVSTGKLTDALLPEKCPVQVPLTPLAEAVRTQEPLRLTSPMELVWLKCPLVTVKDVFTTTSHNSSRQRLLRPTTHRKGRRSATRQRLQLH